LATQKPTTPTHSPVNPASGLTVPISVSAPANNLPAKLRGNTVPPAITPYSQKESYSSPNSDEVPVSDSYPTYTTPPQPPQPNSSESVGGLTVALASLGAASVALSLWLRKWI
ncbi:MAG: hypothetical protein AABZ77_00290, partial [Chloroflexota bacterium]